MDYDSNKILRLKTSVKETLKADFYRTHVEDEIARMQRYTEELAENEAKKRSRMVQDVKSQDGQE